MSTPPYIDPVDLVQRPLGVSWSSIGQQGTANPAEPANMAALNQICRTASTQTDSELGQTVQSTFITEVIRGPSHRMGFLTGSSTARVKMRWNPINKIIGGSVAPVAQYPKTWTQIPMGQIFLESIPISGDLSNSPEAYHGGTNAILVSGNYIGWELGRFGIDLHATFLNGWPHAVLTADVTEGSTTLQVDDVTAFGGTNPWINDGATAEQITVLGVQTIQPPPAYNPALNYASGSLVSFNGVTYQAYIASGPNTQSGVQTPGMAQAAIWSTAIEPVGPGTLSVVDVDFNHSAGATVTLVPDPIIWATALNAKVLALQRGLATLTIDAEGGEVTTLEQAIRAAQVEAVGNLNPYRRVVN